MALRGTIIDTVEELERHKDEWDELACASDLPYCAPGWLLPWWRHMAPADAELRAVAVFDDDVLAAIAPFYARVRPDRLAVYSLLGTELLTARIEPLARREVRDEAAAVMAETLAGASPVPALIRFEGVPADSPWLGLLGAAWPGRGRPLTYSDTATPAPIVTLDSDGFDEWMQTKSGNFRQQMRRSRRKLEKQGAVFQTAQTPAEIDAGLRDFERLHKARWDPRGGSAAMRPGVLEMLVAAGAELAASGRFRLSAIHVDGQAIASHLFLTAGRETSYWLGGFDDRYAAQRPSMLALVDEIAEGFRRGEARFDLGPGDQEYKHRLADAADTLAWTTVAPPGPHHARATGALALRRARYEIAQRLSPNQKARIRRALRRS